MVQGAPDPEFEIWNRQHRAEHKAKAQAERKPNGPSESQPKQPSARTLRDGTKSSKRKEMPHTRPESTVGGEVTAQQRRISAPPALALRLFTPASAFGSQLGAPSNDPARRAAKQAHLFPPPFGTSPVVDLVLLACAEPAGPPFIETRRDFLGDDAAKGQYGRSTMPSGSEVANLPASMAGCLVTCSRQAIRWRRAVPCSGNQRRHCLPPRTGRSVVKSNCAPPVSLSRKRAP